MKAYRLTKANITRFIGKDYYVVIEFEHDKKNIKVLNKVYSSNGCVPKVQIGDIISSPVKINIEDAIENGFETFSIEG